METINQELDEYLVDYELLKFELAKRKIYPVEDAELKDIGLNDIGTSTGSFEQIYNHYNNENPKKNKIMYIVKSLLSISTYYVKLKNRIKSKISKVD